MKYSIFILMHHNPWLINASLISLLMQNRKDYDLHLIYIKGNGEQRHKDSYKKFYKIVDRNDESNRQLTLDDNRILDFLKNSKLKYELHEFENDHGLDSSAWYKIIKNKFWKNYDYNIFLMEGFLFNNQFSLDSILRFIEEKKIDFLDMGFEKRFTSAERIKKMYTRKNISDLEIYHQKQVDYILDILKLDPDYRKLHENWPMNINTNNIVTNNGRTEYHVSDLKFNYFDFIKYFFKRIITDFKVVNFFKKKIFINNDGSLNIYNLSEVTTKYFKYKNIYFHHEKSPYFYGCMCQHVFSKNFLKDLDTKLDQYDFYNKIDVPFSATGLESLWGLYPALLGYNKWFTDAVHRPRKNYISLEREDTNDRLCYYINKYYKNQIQVVPNGDFIKVSSLDNKYDFLKKELNI